MKRALVFAVLAATIVAACGGGNSAATATPTASATASATATPKPIQVGLVTDVGGLNDKSFNQAANTGRLHAEKDFGLKTSVVQSKKQEDYVPNLTTFAQQNYDLVIAVGFLMQNAAWKVAKQFPNVKFAIIDGAPANDAGRTISPTTTILNGYSNDFVDQQKGKEVGLNHISKGCDILFQVAGGSGLGYIAAAKEKGVYAIGVDVDQIDVAPGTVITSAMKRVDKAVYDTSSAVKSGSFKAGDNFFSATNDGIAYGKLDAIVPADAKAAADKALADIKSGAIKPKTDLTVK